jgi:asparagine synthase (glutamine-hydrolysing)
MVPASCHEGFMKASTTVLAVAPRHNKPLLAESVPGMPLAPTRRQKTGFTLPFDAWLRGSLHAWAADRLRIPDSLAPFVDGAAVDDLWRGFGAGKVSFHRVWTLVSLFQWARQHLA